MHDRLKVLFVPNYNVKGAQHILPAADLSEQISTAGKEASGTGNMKFAHLTAHSLSEHSMTPTWKFVRKSEVKTFFFLVSRQSRSLELRSRGHRPRDYYERNSMLRDVIDLIASGALGGGDKKLFGPIVDNLLWHGLYFLLVDYQSYVDCQDQVSALWPNKQAWTRKSILNVARMGKFSSDRSIGEYCEQIWNAKAVHVEVGRWI